MMAAVFGEECSGRARRAVFAIIVVNDYAFPLFPLCCPALDDRGYAQIFARLSRFRRGNTTSRLGCQKMEVRH
jgi:hypothetical protein